MATTTHKKIKIGSLVWITTRESLSNYTSGHFQIPSIQRPGGIFPGVYVTPYDVNDVGLGYPTISNPEYYVDINGNKTNSTVSSEEIKSVNKLYDSYLNHLPAADKKNTLGMVTTNKLFQNRPNKINIRATTSATSNTVTITVPNVTTNTTAQVEYTYYAKGYSKIEDWFSSNACFIKQTDYFSEEERKGFDNIGSLFPQYGKPMKGIVVDAFAPNFKTKKGEKVSFGSDGFPTMYKVLIGEKNCLWFAEEDVNIMSRKDKE